MLIAEIIVPLGVDGTFDYSVENFPEIKEGNIVSVQFRNKNVVGLVVKLTNKDVNQKIIKSIQNIFNVKPLDRNLINLIKSVSDYNLIPLGIVFKMVLSEKILMSRNKRSFNYDKYNINTKNVKLYNLSEEQKTVFKEIEKYISLDNKPILLEGITGSGKTEIYFQFFKKFFIFSVFQEIFGNGSNVTNIIFITRNSLNFTIYR